MPVTNNPPPYLPNNQQAYFFAEGGSITQNVSQAFGPVAGNEAAEFRLTTKFSSAAPVKAYAVCKGIVLIQTQAGTTDKVNLLLRPFKQPYPGLNIKYFVYRGLRKQDFFSAGTDPHVISAVSNVTSDFINKINQDFDSFYLEPLYDPSGTMIPKPAFLAKYIGYDPQQPDTTPISDLFFKESVLTATGGTTTENDAFELPLIDEGKWLGNFETGEGGIDVVLNYGDYKNDFDNSEFVFDLAYARAAEAKIVLTGTDGNKKLQREQVFQFFDAAAFYGLFADGGKVKLYTGGTATDKTGATLYTDVLAPFTTRNNWYLYIQSDRTRSYDYYGNYKIAASSSNNLKLGISETSLVETQYGTNGWPLLINNQQQPVTDGRNRLYLQLVTDNNVNTVLYGQVGVIENAQQDNFCNSDYLRLSPDSQGNYSKLTKHICLETSAEVSGYNIAGLTVLIYQGLSYSYLAGQIPDASGQLVDVYEQRDTFNDIFDLVKSESELKSNDNQYQIVSSEKLNIVSRSQDKIQKNVAVVQTQRVFDTILTDNTSVPKVDRITYLTESLEILGSVVPINEASTPNTITSSSVGESVNEAKTFETVFPYYYETLQFTDSTTSVKGIKLETTGNSTSNKIILGLTNEENNLLKGLITVGHKNTRIYLINTFFKDSKLISSENILYEKYKVGLVVESSRTLSLILPSTDIIVYSLDQRFFFSKLYSEYMAENNVFNKTINKTL